MIPLQRWLRVAVASMIGEVRGSGLEVAEELLAHGMPSLVWGAGPPLVYLRGFSTTHTNPAGLQRLAELRMLRPLAAQFRLHAAGRAPGLVPGVTMAEIRHPHADALREPFGGPVDVLGGSL